MKMKKDNNKQEAAVMTLKIEKALNRLISVLPLKDKQESCGEEIKRLHQQILWSFVEKGRCLSKAEIAQSVTNPDQAVKILADNDMVVLSENGDPVGAYPFTMEDREHRVLVNGHKVHAMCALDALAVSAMFDTETEVLSRCRVTGEPVVVRLSRTDISNPAETRDLHFGILWAAADSCACCADSLCMEMMFLKNAQIAKEWLGADPANREIFNINEAVDFGARFFTPLMH